MRWMLGVCLLAGMALAGSEGAWFPLPNLAGVGLLLMFAVLTRREGKKG